MFCSQGKVDLLFLWLLFVTGVAEVVRFPTQPVKRQNPPDPNVNTGGGINRGGASPFAIPSKENYNHVRTLTILLPEFSE